jgi:uncharacterized membrane protein YciS (DUF1049 family)
MNNILIQLGLGLLVIAGFFVYHKVQINKIRKRTKKLEEENELLRIQLFISMDHHD